MEYKAKVGPDLSPNCWNVGFLKDCLKKMKNSTDNKNSIQDCLAEERVKLQAQPC